MAKRTLVTTAIPGGQLRVEVPCAKCDPCVLVVTVKAHPTDPKLPAKDDLRAAIAAHGWQVNRADQAICPDCR